MPWMKFDRSLAGGSAAVMSGMRRVNSSNNALISSRARFDPRQKCGPRPPKPRCGLGSRPTSKSNGRSNTSSSRFADGYHTVILSPAFNC